METLLLTTSEQDITKAAEIIRKGGLVGMPTETVYGLAADALNPKAVMSIFEAKGRPADNPLIVHISNINDIEKFGLTAEIPEKALRLAEKFWPGPLTVIMPKGKNVPPQVTAGLNSVAIRFPSHKGAQALISKSQRPLAAPSANLSGSPSPTTAQHVMNDLGGRIGAVIDGGDCEVGLESTVVTLCTNPPTLLRPGKVTLEELREVLGEVNLSSAVLEKLKDKEEAPSPGMKYRHYAPNAKVYLVKGDDRAFTEFVNSKTGEGVLSLCYDEDAARICVPYITLGKKGDYDEEAHNLFSALRKIDETPNIKTVYARCPDTKGVGMAVYNRLIRAAGFEVIDLYE
ncbi:MAG: L-threonylcarbamoyladenylate synthase [Eubacteriales bacterium]|nr:L-threonylcarbamoyladenylate synthase [Eubacteriales bacterium]